MKVRFLYKNDEFNMMMMIIIDSVNGMQLVVGGHRFQKKFTSILKIKYPTCSSLWLTYAIVSMCF